MTASEMLEAERRLGERSRILLANRRNVIVDRVGQYVIVDRDAEAELKAAGLWASVFDVSTVLRIPTVLGRYSIE